jgi:asparagine synthetase B (glutamine-hydrolysing)
MCVDFYGYEIQPAALTLHFCEHLIKAPMCGIAGTVGGVGNCSNAARMLRAQANRGPDGSGMVSFEGGVGGAVRIALVDLSDRRQQLSLCTDNLVEILSSDKMYNYVEQRSRLAARRTCESLRVDVD